MAFTVTFIEDWDSRLREAVITAFAALQSQSDITLPEEGNVNLKLVDDTEIAALNEQYTGNAYATDVLTFNYREDGVTTGDVADIAMSLETATRQATEAGVSQAEEVALLVVHGLLHVLGYDHQTAADRRTLEGLQRRILVSAGFTDREFPWID